jgi:hypothetical protein
VVEVSPQRLSIAPFHSLLAPGIQHFHIHLKKPSQQPTNIPHSKYLALSPRTRIIAGVGIMTYAATALYLSDKAEEKFGLVPTPEDKEKLHHAIPKIRAVDRDEVP